MGKYKDKDKEGNKYNFCINCGLVLCSCNVEYKYEHDIKNYQCRKCGIWVNAIQVDLEKHIKIYDDYDDLEGIIYYAGKVFRPYVKSEKSKYHFVTIKNNKNSNLINKIKLFEIKCGVSNEEYNTIKKIEPSSFSKTNTKFKYDNKEFSVPTLGHKWKLNIKVECGKKTKHLICNTCQTTAYTCYASMKLAYGPYISIESHYSPSNGWFFVNKEWSEQVKLHDKDSEDNFRLKKFKCKHLSDSEFIKNYFIIKDILI